MRVGPLLELVHVIEARNSQLLSGPGSEAAVRDVIGAAQVAGATSLIGATPIGHALCGAAIVRSGGTLHLWTPTRPGPVLIVDGIAASDVSPKNLQENLRRLGLRTSIHIVEIAAASTRSSDQHGFRHNEERASRITASSLRRSELLTA